MMDGIEFQCSKVPDVGQSDGPGEKTTLLREWIHQPTNPNCHEQESEKCPQGVIRALRDAALGKKRKSYRHHQREKQQRPKMSEAAKQDIHLASPPRPISYASSTVRRLSIPAAANSRVP